MPELAYDDGGDNIFKKHLQKTIKEYEQLLLLDNFKTDQERNEAKMLLQTLKKQLNNQDDA